MSIEKERYFDLTSGNLSTLLIEKVDGFNCVLKDRNGNVYNGFILAQTDGDRVLTVCDLDFQKSATDDKYQPRLTFRKTSLNFEDRKLRKDVSVVRISFNSGKDGYREFWKMVAFLHQFKDFVDLGDFQDSYKVVDNNSFILEFKSKEAAQKIKGLSELFLKANVSEDTIKQALEDTRKNTLDIFKKLLEEKEYWKTFETENSLDMKGIGEEAVWHHFLKKHDWILGLNADIRFIRDLLSEAEVGIPDTTGKGSPEADLLGISDYTVLVELKTPNTVIFSLTKKSTARANTWSFSDDFIDGISQCLGQKFDWDKDHGSKKIVDEKHNIIDQNKVRTVDPKSIFLISNRSREIPEESANVDILTKRDTFERFRRNNRNIDIITFDELYERAYFIVHNKIPALLSYK